jgi:hypothetical protein
VPRLTKTELALHRAWLSEWRTPADMAAYVEALIDTMGSTTFFRQGGNEFLRDAWLAANFGQHRESEAVRLVPEGERWPDFDARTGGVVERVECAEADVPGRRRGDEYVDAARRAAAGERTIQHDPIENWEARADQVPAALGATVAKKLAKHYAGDASLLVYLNIQEFGIRQAEIEAMMQPAVAPALPHFQRVWILWKARLYGPWVESLR